MSGWMVAFTSPAAEQLAERALTAAGYRAYLPMRREVLRGHNLRRSQVRLRPLFQGYVFALDDGLGPGAASCAKGVEYLLPGAAQLPHLISPESIEAIRTAEHAGMFDDPLPRLPGRPARKEPSQFRPGDRVTVEEGPFHGLIGRIVQADDIERVVVLMSLLGRETTVQTADRTLEKISA